MLPNFQPFNKHAPVEIYHRNLPHWRQDGATYFTTFRLADSIPRSVLAQWNHERKTWLEANGVRESMNRSERAAAYLKIDTKRRKHFEHDNARRLFVELDSCHGSCRFGQTKLRSALQGSMLHFNGERYWSGDLVIMPNHVHWIIQPMAGHALESILQSIKRFTATQFSKSGEKGAGRFWHSESHDRIIRNRDELLHIREYIRDNPQKARLSAERYTHHVADWLDN